jgi:RNA polymerase sigma factor (sigma-70 family)
MRRGHRGGAGNTKGEEQTILPSDLDRIALVDPDKALELLDVHCRVSLMISGTFATGGALQQHADLEDALIETEIEVLKWLRKQHEEKLPINGLLTFARHVMKTNTRSAVRKMNRERKKLQALASNRQQNADENDDQMDGKEIPEHLQRIMHTLPELDRRAVEVKFKLSNADPCKSLKDLATQYRVSNRTVLRALKRGLSRLADALRAPES